MPYSPANGLNTFEKTLTPIKGAATVLYGHGNPEGVVAGIPGGMYYDLDSLDAWIKLAGYGKIGWQPAGLQPVVHIST